MVVSGVLNTKACQWGLGRHLYYLSLEQALNLQKYANIMVGPLVLSVTLARASFCLFLLSALGATGVIRTIL
jgi:hypothetical protein